MPQLLASLTLAALPIVVAEATNPDTQNPLVAYGLLGIILGIFTWLVLTERLVSGKTFQRERDAREATESKLLEFVPLAKEMARATEAILAFLSGRH